MKKGFLSKIRLTGAAGVDEPAHGFAGWVVMKSDDELANAINDAIHPAREQVAADRAKFEEVKRLAAANQRALDELTGQIHGRMEKSTDDTRTKVARLAEDIRRVQAWTGTDVQASIQKAESMDAHEASRLFWGVADE